MDAMDQVRVDMRVVDNTGREVGTVEDFKVGDPEAVTTEGQAPASDGGLVGEIADTLGAGPDIHPQAAERLARTGYLRIDRSGLFGGHAYVGADRIDSVVGDTVTLAVSADELLDG